MSPCALACPSFAPAPRTQDCNGHNNQQWWAQPSFQIVSSNDAKEQKCVCLYGTDSTNGKKIEVWDCLKKAEDQDGGVRGQGAFWVGKEERT